MGAWLRLREAAELRLLLAALALVAGLWAFAELASEVVEGDSRAFDEWVLRALREPQDPSRGRGPDWLAAAALDVTALGGVAVLTLVLAAVTGFVLLLRKPHMAVLLLAAGGGGLALNQLLKSLVARPRPTVVPPLDTVHTLSFPSGHAMLSAAIYLSLGVLVARLLGARRERVYVLAVAAGLSVMIGLTRTYLGVHYPTDVLAGWLAGGVWALACGVGARALQRHGKVEPPADTPD